MNVQDNKYLKVAAGVILTPIIIPVICALDKYFEGLPSWVTSGLRDANDQLRVIRGYLKKKQLDKLYPEAMICKVTDMISGQYAWQMAWSHLLNVGVIINPALEAKCLMHTTFDARDRFNQVLHQTPHASGKAFNIGGGGNGVTDEAERMKRAQADKVKGLKDFLVERENNAVHVNCYA